MIVRRLIVFFFALLALFLAGCGGGGNTVTADETTDPVYQQAQDLKKQGRNGEALSAFLKVIDRRGESGAPESHLEAGALYLTWAKDPVEAYHHFSKFLELQPTGQRADIVRGQRDAAKREIARMLLAPAPEQMVQVSPGTADELDQLRRRVQELEAENRALQGGSAGVPVTHGPPMIQLPSEPAAGSNEVAANNVPIIPTARPGQESDYHGAAAPASNGIARGVMTGEHSEVRSVVPTRPATPQRPANSPAQARRAHTVTQKESLWAIGRRYYGSSVNAAKVQGIYEANRDVMTSPSDLRVGMVLRIP